MALNKLSGNGIDDGVKDVSQLEVDISGASPESGYVVIEDGRVKHAELEVNGYTVTCDEKGKCEAFRGTYVYYASVGTPTSVSDCVTSRPTNQNAYLKFKTENNKLQTPQACLYDNGEEVCLGYGEDYFDLYDKIVTHYGFNESTWTQNSNPSFKEQWSTTINGEFRACEVDPSAADYIICANARVKAYIDQTSGDIQTLDMATNYNVFIDYEGEASGSISQTP